MTPEEFEAKIAKLEDKIVGLDAEIVELKRVRLKRLIQPLVAVFVSMFVAVGVSIGYTYTSNQNWCDVVVGLDERYQQVHTTDPAAIKFAQQIHTLRHKFHCS